MLPQLYALPSGLGISLTNSISSPVLSSDSPTWLLGLLSELEGLKEPFSRTTQVEHRDCGEHWTFSVDKCVEELVSSYL